MSGATTCGIPADPRPPVQSLLAIPDEHPPSYTPQSVSDLLPIYGPIKAYTLRQKSSDTQRLTPIGDHPSGIQYNIKTFATGGFMNRNPHVIISKNELHGPSQCSELATSQTNSNDLSRTSRKFSIIPRRNSDPQPTAQQNNSSKKPTKTAEGRFEIGGTGTTIVYPSSPSLSQRLTLYNSQAQILRTTIADTPHYWQPHAGNKHVFELINETDDIVARFVYSATALALKGTITGKKGGSGSEMDVGELDISEGLMGGEDAKEQIICSAAIVIERAKRRASLIKGRASEYKHSDGGGASLWSGGF